MKCARALLQQIGGPLQRRARASRPAFGSSAAKPSRAAAIAAFACAGVASAMLAGRWHASRPAIVGDSSWSQRRALAEFDARANFAAAADRDRAAAGCSDARASSALPMMSAGRCSSVRHRHGLVGGQRDEGRIGAVLQQPPHQIGEQVAVAADRRIGAAGDVGAILAELRVERLAHAVQALEFEAAARRRQLEDGRDRQRIVGGELRKDARPQRQQLLRAGDVVQIRHRLAGEHRIAVEPALLRALDLGVPIGALDQPHHQPAVERCARDRRHSRSRRARASDRPGSRAQSRPSRRARDRPSAAAITSSDSSSRSASSASTVKFRSCALACRARSISRGTSSRHHPLAAHRLEARMQRRELDRDAGPVGQGLSPAARPIASIALA